MSTRFALLLLAFAAVGCNKNVFFATAPAKPGWVYVVGSKNDRAQAWLCPAAPNIGGRCHEIDIEESDR